MSTRRAGDFEHTAAIAQLNEILLRRHRIRPGESSDFAVRNLSQIAETAEGSSRVMALLLAAVASISLLVGVPLVAILGGFLFSAAVGVFFGYYPAPQGRAPRSDRGVALRVNY